MEQPRESDFVLSGTKRHPPVGNNKHDFKKGVKGSIGCCCCGRLASEQAQDKKRGIPKDTPEGEVTVCYIFKFDDLWFCYLDSNLRPRLKPTSKQSLFPEPKTGYGSQIATL